MIINIKEISEEAKSNPYSATSYNFTGAYYDSISEVLYFVDKPNNVVTAIYNAKRFFTSTDMDEGSNKSITSSNSLDSNIDNILKVIAIYQKPELVKDLV